MRKSLSLALAVILLLSALIVPLQFTVSAEEPILSINVESFRNDAKYDWSYNVNNIFYHGEDVKSTYGVATAKVIVFEWNVFAQTFVVKDAYSKNGFTNKVIPANGFALTVDTKDTGDTATSSALGTGDTCDALIEGTVAYLYGIDLAAAQTGAVSDVKITLGAPDATETRDYYVLPGQKYAPLPITRFYSGKNDFGYTSNSLSFQNDPNNDSGFAYGAADFKVMMFKWDDTDKCFKVSATYNADGSSKAGAVIPKNGFTVVVAANPELVGRDKAVEIPVGTKAYLYGLDLFTAESQETVADVTLTFGEPDASLGEPFEYFIKQPAKELKVNSYFYGGDDYSGNVSVYYRGNHYEESRTDGAAAHEDYLNWGAKDYKIAVFDWDFAEGVYKLYSKHDAGIVKDNYSVFVPETGFALIVYKENTSNSSLLGEGDAVDLPLGTKAYVYGLDFFNDTEDSKSVSDASVVLEEPLENKEAFVYSTETVKPNKVAVTSTYFGGDNGNYFGTRYNSLYYGRDNSVDKKLFYSAKDYMVMVCDWDYKDGRYEIVEVLPDDGSDKSATVIPANGFCYTVCRDYEKNIIKNGEFVPGTPVYIYGVDLLNDAEKTNGLGYTYLMLGEKDASATEFVYSTADAVINGGASILNDDAFETAGKQALRVYYGYSLNSNNEMFVDGSYETIVERGIIVSSPAKLGQNEMILENVDGDTILNYSKTEKLMETCWSYDESSNTVIFSNYIKDIEENKYDAELIFRGYVKLSNGTVVYAKESTTYSVNSVLEAQ